MPDMSKEQRRQAMPECTKFLDDMRKHFGEPVSIKAQENGIKVDWKKTEQLKEKS